MGPGVKIDPARTRDVVAELEGAREPVPA
jgi:hypothetical protein